MLSVNHVTGGYPGHDVLHDLSFEVKKGELLGIVGPNGSGKTTIFKMVSGILKAQSGEILLKEKPIASYSAKQLAKVLAVLPQHAEQAFPYTVKETVSLGRYAHQTGWFQMWSEHDEAVVQQTMEQTGIAAFQDQYVNELSGGERQRVFLAQALAQEPEILLLDEPTNHLDLSYQKELLDLLKKWTREQGLTVISIFHDLNLAGLYCDRLLLLEDGKINLHNNPNEVLNEERIQSVYRTNIEKHPHPTVPKPQMLLLPEKHADDLNDLVIDERYLERTDETLTLTAPFPLRTMSSGVVGSGTGWYSSFVNRHVDKSYNCTNHREEMRAFLQDHNIDPTETVGMMTAVQLEDVSYRLINHEEVSVFIVVTAGGGNAVDASRSRVHDYNPLPGTINTWIFVSGTLTDEAFIQSIMTATEAKAKVMQDQEIKDALTGTIATGTPTDSILIAATQRGAHQPYGGTITTLGKLVSEGVYTCTTEALSKHKRRGQARA
ncbi:adenosylcobinamide amidohydrolase [Pseudalkalibacillus hwajinpoensis]|uniref:ATP-binding cassette domain-containing protein n=1 Tax=Guptibacillus hwajinpoensis TaxID=208199 RepID=A0A4U1MI65_9BACL|nr:adenosylcobinamide amidohydrolase [Pseudalkalibacillus hwajinpoensis]TKD70703.1 ATP-binding cassette domain-containing protein [Pseudalkalibacillus hwajinpoensis]